MFATYIYLFKYVTARKWLWLSWYLERSLPTREVRDSNPVIGNTHSVICATKNIPIPLFARYIHFLLLINYVLCKIKGKIQSIHETKHSLWFESHEKINILLIQKLTTKPLNSISFLLLKKAIFILWRKRRRKHFRKFKSKIIRSKSANVIIILSLWCKSFNSFISPLSLCSKHFLKRRHRLILWHRERFVIGQVWNHFILF